MSWLVPDKTFSTKMDQEGISALAPRVLQISLPSYLGVLPIAYFYKMKVSFGTKEEHKRKKQEEFLALSPAERFYAFLRLSRRIAEFPVAHKENESTSNFVIKPKANS